MLKCLDCNNEAAYVLVNYYHEIIGTKNVFCHQHAFMDGREKCPCCYDYDIEVYDNGADLDISLLPCYPQGTLDNEGCCSEHP